jgi:hypothetical protein
MARPGGIGALPQQVERPLPAERRGLDAERAQAASELLAGPIEIAERPLPGAPGSVSTA